MVSYTFPIYRTLVHNQRRIQGRCTGFGRTPIPPPAGCGGWKR